MTLTVEMQKHIDLACLILFPAGLLAVFLLATMGYAVGSYGDTYIATTHLVIAGITAILPALRYMRVIVMPYWFVFIVTVNIYAYGIPLFLGFYDNIWWWDEFAHWMSSILVTMTVFTAMCIIDAVADNVSMSPSVMCFLTFIGGFALGNIWELFEGTVDWVFGQNYMQHHIQDTLSDIHMDFIGSLTMDAIASVILRKKDVHKMVEEIDERDIFYNLTHRAR